MSVAIANLKDAEEKLLRAALRGLLAERGLADENGNVLAVNATSKALAFAARDLTRAVDELPMERKPKGWVTS